MAIVACHLHARVIGADQIWLQVRVVVEFEAAEIFCGGTGDAKLRVLLLEACHGRLEFRIAVFRA